MDVAPTIDELTVADEPARWEALGFEVANGCCELGTVCVRLVGEQSGRGIGIVGWSLRDVGNGELDGLPTQISTSAERAPAQEHPNGALALDHVVVFSPALDRTIAALESAGLQLRRVREEPTPAGAPRQAFFRLGEVILEVIQLPEEQLGRAGGADAPARLWGLAVLVADIERTAQRLGEQVGEIRPAVQRGRRITTLRRSVGLAVPLALMSPAPAREEAPR